MNIKTNFKYNEKKALSFDFLAVLILGAIIIIIFLMFFFTTMQSSDKYFDNQDCISLLSRLDQFGVNQNEQTIQGLINQKCQSNNISIQNQEQLLKEIEICNTKAQVLSNQDTFLSRLNTQSACFICNSITSSSIQQRISTKDNIEDINQYRNIQDSSLEIINSNNNDEVQRLIFKIEHKHEKENSQNKFEISFHLLTQSQNSQCSGFLNS
ncbi:MAG: hypothetical protein ACLFPL_00385 [Candidatus Nanoarchaeia archaeon]